jgi:hypothetical protein
MIAITTSSSTSVNALRRGGYARIKELRRKEVERCQDTPRLDKMPTLELPSVLATEYSESAI